MDLEAVDGDPAAEDLAEPGEERAGVEPRPAGAEAAAEEDLAAGQARQEPERAGVDRRAAEGAGDLPGVGAVGSHRFPLRFSPESQPSFRSRDQAASRIQPSQAASALAGSGGFSRTRIDRAIG